MPAPRALRLAAGDRRLEDLPRLKREHRAVNRYVDALTAPAPLAAEERGEHARDGRDRARVVTDQDARGERRIGVEPGLRHHTGGRLRKRVAARVGRPRSARPPRRRDRIDETWASLLELFPSEA